MVTSIAIYCAIGIASAAIGQAIQLKMSVDKLRKEIDTIKKGKDA